MEQKEGAYHQVHWGTNATNLARCGWGEWQHPLLSTPSPFSLPFLSLYFLFNFQGKSW